MCNKKNICFADFEFTCGYNINKFKSEILSVGIVICDGDYKIKEKFYCTCRPYRFPKLTKQCLKLTHLTQTEIDNSPDSNDVMAIVLNLVQRYSINCILVWGNFDRMGLISDMKQHTKFKKECQNIRKVSKKITDIQKSLTEKMNLPEAVNIEELASAFDYVPVSGTFHNALNDAIALYSIYKAVNTENVMENEKLSEIRRGRIEKIERNRLKAEQKQQELAFSMTLSAEERRYYDGIKGDAKKELAYIMLRSKFVGAMQRYPEETDFLLVYLNDGKTVKVIPKEKYNYTLQNLSERTVAFLRKDFSDVILDECTEKETATV